MIKNRFEVGFNLMVLVLLGIIGLLSAEIGRFDISVMCILGVLYANNKIMEWMK